MFASAAYYAESGEPDTKFTSIPTAFWYALISMTTVGYGDLVPETGIGKLIGSICIISGVLILSLPIVVIVDNFQNLYEEKNRASTVEESGINQQAKRALF